MGAFYGVGIDNAIVEIRFKRSSNFRWFSKIICRKIKNVGLKFSDQPIKIIKIDKK